MKQTHVTAICAFTLAVLLLAGSGYAQQTRADAGAETPVSGVPAGEEKTPVPVTVPATPVPVDEPVVDSAPEEERVWVFIPVNADGEPTGEDYYIPLEMFRNLYRKPGEEAETAAEAEKAYYFHDAVYTGHLRMSVSSGTVTADTIHAVFDLEVLQPDARVFLPMKATEIYLSPGGASLNGTPLQIFWEDGKLTFDVPRPGRYTLELRFYPILEDVPAESVSGTDAGENMAGVQRGISFAIPRIARSRLEMEVPANMGELIFPTAKGEVRHQALQQKWSVHLGDASQVLVRWKKPVRAETAAPAATVEEFYHWDFTPRGITLQCRYRYRFTRGNVTSLEWVTDPRAAVQALAGNGTEGINGTGTGTTEPVKNPVTDAVSVMPPVRGSENTLPTVSSLSPLSASRAGQLKTFADGNRQRIRMDFASPLAEQCVVGFDLHFPQKSSVGKHVLPYIHPRDARTVRRWVAVSGFGMSLEFQNISGGTSMLTVPEFMFIWTELGGMPGGGRQVKALMPLFVVDDTAAVSTPGNASVNISGHTPGAVADYSADMMWCVHSRPAESVCTVSEVTSVLCEADRLRVQYMAAFPATEPVPFFCHLRVPENVRINRLFLRESGQDTDMRFSRISPTLLGVFMENSASRRILRENRFLHSDPRTKLFPPVETPSAPRLVLEGEVPVMAPEGASDAAHVPLPGITLTDTFFKFSARTVNVFRGRKVLLDFENLAPEVQERSSFSAVRVKPEEEMAGAALLADAAVTDFRTAQLSANLAFLPEEEVAGTLLVRENRPEVEVWRRTTMEPRENGGGALSPGENQAAGAGNGAGAWTAKMELLLDVKAGLLDTFTVELPRNWQGPFTLEPAIPFTVEAPAAEGTENAASPEKTAGETPAEQGESEKIVLPQGRKRLVLRPSHPFQAKQRLVITGPVTETRGALEKGEVSFVVPRVTFPGAKVMQEDVILPVMKENVEVAGKISRWVLEGVSAVEESGLGMLDVSPGAADKDASQPIPVLRSRPGVTQIYRVTGVNHLVRLQVSSTVPPQIDHLWTSHHILWDAGRGASGKIGFQTLSIYDFIPQDVFSCVVAVPESCTPLEFRLDGMPAQVETLTPALTAEQKASGDDRERFYQISFHGDGLPRRLEILSYGETSRQTVTGSGSRLPREISPKDAESAFLLKLPRLETGRRAAGGAGGAAGACFVYVPADYEMKFWSRMHGGGVRRFSPRPLLRVELIYMEHLVRLAQMASRRQEAELADGGANTGKTPEVVAEEAACWQMLWVPHWQRAVSQVGGHLKNAEKPELREYQHDFEARLAEGNALFRRQNPTDTAGEYAPAAVTRKPLRTAFMENVTAIFAEQASGTLENAADAMKILTFDYGDVSSLAAEGISASGVESEAAGDASPSAAGTPESLAGKSAPGASGFSGEFFFTESPAAASTVRTPFTPDAARRMSHSFTAIVILLVTITLLAGISLFPSILDVTRTSPYWLIVTGILWLLCDFVWWPAVIMFVFAIFIIIVRARRVVGVK